MTHYADTGCACALAQLSLGLSFLAAPAESPAESLQAASWTLHCLERESPEGAHLLRGLLSAAPGLPRLAPPDAQGVWTWRYAWL